MKICPFKIISSVLKLKKSATAAVVVLSLLRQENKMNRRETCEWQKTVTLLVLGFVLCVQGIVWSDRTEQDPLSLAKTCASSATLTPGYPVGDDLAHHRSLQMNLSLQHIYLLHGPVSIYLLVAVIQVKRID